jgi:hypothetical protein
MIGRTTREGGVASLFIVDAEYAEAVGRHKWISKSGGYLKAVVDGEYTLLHRFVWRLKHGTVPPLIDHINGVGWDCRLSNLREASTLLNALNKTRHRRRKVSLPRGVRLGRSKANPYLAKITVAGKQRHLGSFSTPELASAAYERARESAIREEASKHKAKH